jgi:small subunit ribosomal protein S18
MNDKSNRNNRNNMKTSGKKVRRFIEGYIDYKDTKQLQKFLTDQGKIIPRRITGLTAKQHRELVVAIKRARHLAILPFVTEAVK